MRAKKRTQAIDALIARALVLQGTHHNSGAVSAYEERLESEIGYLCGSAAATKAVSIVAGTTVVSPDTDFQTDHKESYSRLIEYLAELRDHPIKKLSRKTDSLKKIRRIGLSVFGTGGDFELKD